MNSSFASSAFTNMFNNPYSKHYNQVLNPQLPYTSDIPFGIKPGKQISVAGVVKHNADQFRFDFLTNNGSIAFVINPRFHANCVVRNTERGGWGPEERGGGMPFAKGQPFELTVSVEQDKYRCFVNGQHTFDYAHRLPFQEVTKFQVQGEIDVHRIVYFGGNNVAHEALNLTSPVIQPIHGGCQAGRMVQIYATPSPNCQQFQVQMQAGANADPADIQFCFNPRFNDPYTGQAVVRVNRHGGAWGAEEREVTHFPFQKGVTFELLIRAEDGQWKVAVNGQHYVTFHHRSPLHEANFLQITGDLQIASVRQF